MRQEYLAEIDAIWNKNFNRPWRQHLDQFNSLVEHKANHRFWLPNRFCSPAWINGNPRLMNAGDWVLVVSLNPHIDPNDNKLETGIHYSSRDWQRFWEDFNATQAHWKGDFFPRLGRLASSCLGLTLDREQARIFVHERMLFIEFCPYASPGFQGLSWKDWKSLAQGDRGIHIARNVRQLLFDFGEPALVLCNGKFAAFDVNDQQFNTHDMHTSTILHKVTGKKPMTVYSGFHEPKLGARFPVVGFNQIGRQYSSTNLEMEAIRQLVDDMRTSSVDPTEQDE